MILPIPTARLASMGWELVEFWRPETYYGLQGPCHWFPRTEIRIWVRDRHIAHGCYRCGTKDKAAQLCFHHVDPSTKLFNIAPNVRGSISFSKLIAEIAKCIILCNSCHKKVHIHGDPRFFVGTPKKPSGRKPREKALAQENPSRTLRTLPNDVPNLLGQKEKTKPLTT